jgi:hypothetical protein
MWYNTDIEFIAPRAANTGAVRHEGLASMSDVNDTTPLRRCKKCQREFPLTLEYFANTCHNLTWFEYKCRECNGGKFGQPNARLVSDREGYKICTSCLKELPATSEYFSKMRRWLNSKCRECLKLYAYSHYHNHPQREVERQYRELRKALSIIPDGVLLYKTCTRCGIRKPATKEYFYAQPRGLYGFFASCKKCDIERTTLNYRQNPHKYRAWQKAWYAKNRDRDYARTREYARRHPEKIRLYSQRRQSRKRSLADTLTHSQWLECLEWWNNCCAYCGKQRDFWHTIEMEHFIPVSADECPGTVATNIIPSKSNKAVKQWLIGRFGNRKAAAILRRIEEYFESVK